MSVLMDVMTLVQVADRLQMHPMAMCRYANQPRLAAAKVGGRYRMKSEAVKGLLT